MEKSASINKITISVTSINKKIYIETHLGILSISPLPNRLNTIVTLIILSAVYSSLCPSNIT